MNSEKKSGQFGNGWASTGKCAKWGGENNLNPTVIAVLKVSDLQKKRR